MGIRTPSVRTDSSKPFVHLLESSSNPDFDDSEFSFLRNYSTSSDFLCKDIRGNLSYYLEVQFESFARGNWVNENSLPRAQRGNLKSNVFSLSGEIFNSILPRNNIFTDCAFLSIVLTGLPLLYFFWLAWWCGQIGTLWIHIDSAALEEALCALTRRNTLKATSPYTKKGDTTRLSLVLH